MTRKELERYIAEMHGIKPDFPWSDTPEHAVFRHPGNRKWFALVMELSCEKLGLQGAGRIDILNVKCDPLLIGSLRTDPGFFPAYHMSKTNWITIALDGTVPDDTICWLLELSFNMTAPRYRTARPSAPAQQ